MRKTYKEIKKILKRLKNVDVYLGNLTRSEVEGLREQFPDYEITQGYFGYWKFKEKPYTFKKKDE